MESEHEEENRLRNSASVDGSAHSDGQTCAVENAGPAFNHVDNPIAMLVPQIEHPADLLQPDKYVTVEDVKLDSQALSAALVRASSQCLFREGSSWLLLCCYDRGAALWAQSNREMNHCRRSRAEPCCWTRNAVNTAGRKQIKTCNGTTIKSLALLPSCKSSQLQMQMSSRCAQCSSSPCNECFRQSFHRVPSFVHTHPCNCTGGAVRWRLVTAEVSAGSR